MTSKPENFEIPSELLNQKYSTYEDFIAALDGEKCNLREEMILGIIHAARDEYSAELSVDLTLAFSVGGKSFKQSIATLTLEGWRNEIDEEKLKRIFDLRDEATLPAQF